MNNDEIAKLLLQVSSAAGIAHSGTYKVRKDAAEIVLHHRLNETARRKMRKKWNELVADKKRPPRLRIRTHRFAMSVA